MRRAVTLIELLITLLIVAILSVVIIISVSGSIEDARRAAWLKQESDLAIHLQSMVARALIAAQVADGGIDEDLWYAEAPEAKDFAGTAAAELPQEKQASSAPIDRFLAKFHQESQVPEVQALGEHGFSALFYTDGPNAYVSPIFLGADGSLGRFRMLFDMTASDYRFAHKIRVDFPVSNYGPFADFFAAGQVLAMLGGQLASDHQPGIEPMEPVDLKGRTILEFDGTEIDFTEDLTETMTAQFEGKVFAHTFVGTFLAQAQSRGNLMRGLASLGSGMDIDAMENFSTVLSEVAYKLDSNADGLLTAEELGLDQLLNDLSVVMPIPESQMQQWMNDFNNMDKIQRAGVAAQLFLATQTPSLLDGGEPHKSTLIQKDIDALCFYLDQLNSQLKELQALASQTAPEDPAYADYQNQIQALQAAINEVENQIAYLQVILSEY